MSIFKTPEAQPYEVQGIQLKCQVCGHNGFVKRDVQLNTRFATLLNLDWANASATCFVCEKCGYIHWFLPK
jgi:predicted nucleic-acid-binding Zn-ribbon protein